MGDNNDLSSEDSKWATSSLGIDDSISNSGPNAVEEINKYLEAEEDKRKREQLAWQRAFGTSRNQRLKRQFQNSLKNLRVKAWLR